MILTGLTAIIAIEIYAAIMQMEFQNTDNKVGKGFAVLGIYLFCESTLDPNNLDNCDTSQIDANILLFTSGTVYYGLINSTTWLYGAEVVPMVRILDNVYVHGRN